MDLLIGAALVAAGAVVGVAVTVLACAAGRTTAYLEGYRLGLGDGKLEEGGHEPNED